MRNQLSKVIGLIVSWLSSTVLLLSVGGCVTLSQTTQATDDRKAVAPPSAFVHAVVAGRDEEAIRIYTDQPGFFRSDEDLAQVKALSLRLQQANATPAAEALAKLAALRLPEKKEGLNTRQVDAWAREWSDHQQVMSLAKALLERALMFPPLRKDGDFPDSVMLRLQAKFDQLNLQYQALAAVALTLYNHNASIGFFEAYPIGLAHITRRPEFRNIKVRDLRLNPRVPAASTAIKRLYDQLPDEVISRDLVSLAIQAEGVRRGFKLPLTFSQRLLAWAAIKTQYPGGSLDIPIITLAPNGESKALVSQTVNQLGGVKQMGSMPEVQESLLELKKNDRQEAFVVVVGNVKSVQGITALKPTSRQRLSSKVTTENPEYSRAVAALSRAQSELTNAEMENQRIISQVNSTVRGAGSLGVLMGASALTLGGQAVGEARREVQEARAALARTPRTLERTQYEQYEALSTSTSRHSRLPLYLMLVDLKRGSFRGATFNLEDKHEATALAVVASSDTSPGAAATPFAPPVPFSVLSATPIDELLANFESYKPSAPAPLQRMAQHVERLESQSERLQVTEQAKLQSQTQDFEQQLSQHRQKLSALDQRQQQPTNVTRSASGGTNSGSEACPNNLSGLRSRIPSFSNPQIQEIRDKILNSNVRQMIQAAKRQGFTTGEMAAEASMRQAEQHELTARQAAATASAVDALGHTDEEFFASISSGRLNPQTCDGIRNKALCAAVMARMGAVGSRATAAAMTCHAQMGTY